MWLDDDDRIVDILNNIEPSDKECFPVVCPVCGKRQGHLYFHRYKEGNERGGMWVWCSACHHSEHATYRVPKWWKNLESISFEKLAAIPLYLEKNKADIDEWVNRLIFPELSSGKEDML